MQLRSIELFSYVGETVLDPFCGYGTTLRAAKNLGRNYIGIDISEKYCKLAEKRISSACVDNGLMDFFN